MKGIFISQAVINKNNGGGQFIKSLISILQLIVGEDNLDIASLPSQFDLNKENVSYSHFKHYNCKVNTVQKGINLLNGCPKYVSKKIFDVIMDDIHKNDYDFIFIGFSTYKYFIEKIKAETNIPVFVMYHGIAPNTKKSKLLNSSIIKKILAYPSYKLVYAREKSNVQLANCNIVLNEREKNLFVKYYHKEPDMLLPIFIKDKFSTLIDINPGIQSFSLLFIGSYFGPNLTGLRWFVTNVMSHLSSEVNLYVVGQGMEQLRKNSLYQKKNIKIIGEVDSLAPWYYYSDLVVEPIFEGDGMKTKTVEAMMYGKVILGTDEAFCGYEGLDKYLCNTSNAFIDRITYYQKNGVNKINSEVREIYLKHYSENAVLKIIKKGIGRHVNIK
jgi:effector-binding domain-containing protein